MWILYVIGLGFVAIAALVFALLAFMGKDIILDDTYIKASKKEQERMNRKAYRLQSAIIFLFIAALTLCNMLRIVLNVIWFAYAAYGIFIVGIIYAIVSHYLLKKKSK